MRGNKLEVPTLNEKQCIVRTSFSGIKYNSYIPIIENCEVIVVRNGMPKRLKHIDEGIINPQENKSLFSPKIDPVDSVVFFIDSSYHKGAWGGHIQNEKAIYNIRAHFFYRIVRGDRVLPLLTSGMDEYSEHDMLQFVRSLLTPQFVNAILPQIISNRAFDARNVRDLINQTMTSDYGIEIDELLLTVETVDQVAETSKNDNKKIEKENTNNVVVSQEI